MSKDAYDHRCGHRGVVYSFSRREKAWEDEGLRTTQDEAATPVHYSAAA